MATRITGLATGLDVDTIVKQTMQAYRTKIDTQQQKKDVTEIKQQLYRDLIKEAQELYNTHFDVLKEGSLIKGSTWQSIKFTSSSSNLTVTGASSATVGNYTIQQGSKIAKAATITKTELGNKITINGQEFEVTGSTTKEKADNLNKALTNAGINVSVKYTDFAGTTSGANNNKSGFVFESKTLGVNNNFVIGGTKENTVIKNGEDAKGAEITGLTVTKLKDNAIENKVSFKIDGTEITIDIANKSEYKDIEDILNKALSDKGYTAKIDTSGNITLITTKTGKGQTEPSIEVKNKNGTYDKIIIGFTDGKNATSAEEIKIASTGLSGKILINGVCIDLSQKGSINEVDYINDILKNNKISVVAENGTNGIVLKSTTTGSNSKVEFSNLKDGEISTGGQDAKIIISNGNGVYTHTGTTNNFPLDGITFNFTGDIPDDGIKVTSKQDSTEIIDKIKSYIEDYNKLIIKINTLTSEKRDRNYQPLTKDQKAEMSEKEIELWEAKVKQGQLRRDSDLTRIVNSLKQGMSTMVSGSGLTLENIGISSVQDYGGTKDGTFKINESKLKEAIENDTEAVSKLFIQSAPSGTSESDAYSKNGIMMRLKDILYDETVSSKSVLAKKVGFEGTTTVANNTLTKQMTEYQKKIDEMEKLFSRKEQELYTKYAKLETIMSNYNNQMTYLSQSLGLSS